MLYLDRNILLLGTTIPDNVMILEEERYGFGNLFLSRHHGKCLKRGHFSAYYRTATPLQRVISVLLPLVFNSKTLCIIGWRAVGLTLDGIDAEEGSTRSTDVET